VLNFYLLHFWNSQETLNVFYSSMILVLNILYISCKIISFYRVSAWVFFDRNLQLDYQSRKERYDRKKKKYMEAWYWSAYFSDNILLNCPHACASLMSCSSSTSVSAAHLALVPWHFAVWEQYFAHATAVAQHSSWRN